jgi:hypothetical protein
MADQRTEYVVLKFPTATGLGNQSSASPPQGLKMVGRAKASNADFAIREIAEKEGAGQYVAVPARSWVPRTVNVETVTAVSFAKESA